MSPEQPLPHNTPVNQWEISVACDRSLAQIFTDNPTLPKGSAITIDPSAIEKALTTINPNVSGKLLFIATHDESLNGSFDKPTTTLGVAKRHRRHGEHTVKVVVAGGIGAFFDSDTLLAIKDEFNYLSKNGSDNSPENKTDAHVQKKEIVKRIVSKGRLLPPATQQTAVHELTHAVDFEDPEAIKRDKKYLRRTAAIGSSAAAGCVFVTSNLVGLSANIFTNSTPGLFAATILGGTAGLVGYNRAVEPRLKRRRYKNDPSEIKANANEVLASQLPAIITYTIPE